MPYPNKGESSEDFIARCMSDEEMKRKHPNTKQRSGACYGHLRTKRGKSVDRRVNKD